MTVTLTSPVLGLAVGATYTGALEDWLLSQGYASRAGYTGPGVANTGVADVVPAKDPTLASNRADTPKWPQTPEEDWTIANDATNLTKTKFPGPGDFDYDQGGVNDDAPDLQSLSPANGAAAGGDVVTLKGENFKGTTGVTFGGVAGTALEVVDDETIKVTTGAHAAGAVDVVVTNATGNDTLAGAYTYA